LEKREEPAPAEAYRGDVVPEASETVDVEVEEQ
jgi:hypothetical protein